MSKSTELLSTPKAAAFDKQFVTPNGSFGHASSSNSTLAATAESSMSEGQAPVQAYAKLEGPDFCYYVRTLEVSLGRHPSGADSVDIDLGDSKAVSRRHAKIHYNFMSQSFELQVFGKNGCLVDDEYFAKGQCVGLRHKMVIQIGDTEFTFLLPKAAMAAPPHDASHARALAAAPLDMAPVYAHAAYASHAPAAAAPHAAYPVNAITPQRLNLYPAADGGRPVPAYGAPARLSPARRGSVAAAPDREAPAPLSFGDAKAQQAPGSSPARAQKAQAQQRRQATPQGEVRILPATERPAGGDAQADGSHAKPTYSYASLIAQAINSTDTAKITLNGIYTYIMAHYPYYKHAQNGWQNSNRHNMSLNKAFVRVQRASNEPGKGSYWAIDDAYKGQFANGVYKRTRRTKKAMEIEREKKTRPQPDAKRAAPIAPRARAAGEKRASPDDDGDDGAPRLPAKRLSVGAQSTGDDTVGYMSNDSARSSQPASPGGAEPTPPAASTRSKAKPLPGAYAAPPSIALPSSSRPSQPRPQRSAAR
ncbi:hypothetical protein LPJ70_002412 [Coemansia sp. RSA 2708]|nr:hypothetical protein LPJ70_002412 [Coemansia sp. RSA 2708]